jgi:alpha-tubulin suppressor-like RCC1 family protein
VAISLPSGAIPTKVAAGRAHSVAIDAEGHVCSWGANAHAELGDGSIFERHVPGLVNIPNGVAAVDVAAGGAHSLAIGADGLVYAWGDNNYGELGDDTTDYRGIPIAVSLPDGHVVIAIAASDGHSLAIGAKPAFDFEHHLYAWGANEFGELGDGTTINRHTPVPVVGLPRPIVLTSIAVGAFTAWPWTTRAPSTPGAATSKASWAMGCRRGKDPETRSPTMHTGASLSA